jgi:myo-inositol-1(or 4)-monophosphatase
LLQTAITAARAAGEIIRERYARPHEVKVKGLRDLVTEVDLLAQEAILAHIRADFPTHQIMTEESTQVLGGQADYRWFIDPLDGTTNYARGLPSFATSIGVAHGSELVVGVVYDPLHDHLFTAERGQGAYLNGRRLRVSVQDELIDALMDLGWARNQQARKATVRVAAAIGERIGSVRNLGSAALGLAAIAAGWEDIYWHPDLCPWDDAAGALLVLEAGGKISDSRGAPWNVYTRDCLATNGRLHDLAVQYIGPAVSGT